MTPEMHLLLAEIGIHIEPRRPFVWYHSGEVDPNFLEPDRDFLAENGPAIVELLEEGGLERLVGLAIQKEKERIET